MCSVTKLLPQSILSRGRFNSKRSSEEVVSRDADVWLAWRLRFAMVNFAAGFGGMVAHIYVASKSATTETTHGQTSLRDKSFQPYCCSSQCSQPRDAMFANFAIAQDSQNRDTRASVCAHSTSSTRAQLRLCVYGILVCMWIVSTVSNTYMNTYLFIRVQGVSVYTCMNWMVCIYLGNENVRVLFIGKRTDKPIIIPLDV